MLQETVCGKGLESANEPPSPGDSVLKRTLMLAIAHPMTTYARLTRVLFAEDDHDELF